MSSIIDNDDPVALEQKLRLIKLLRHKNADRAFNDLYFFAKNILGYSEMRKQPHAGLTAFVAHPDHDHQLILEPRGSFKTSVVTISYSIWSIIRNPDIRILIDSEDLSICKTFLREIKGHFESNEDLKKLFGDYVGDKWTETEIITGRRMRKHLKEPTIATSGVETTRVSQHYDLIIRDDLHSQQNVSTPEQIEKVKTHVKLSLSLLEPHGRDITIGTRWHYADAYSDMLEKEELRVKAGLPPRLSIRISKAIYPDGSLHFPHRLTKEFLEDQKIEQGSYVFSCQYQNEPVDEETARFKKVNYRYYGDTPPKGLYITSVLDPAVSEKDNACYTAIITIGVDVEGNIYVLGVYREKVNPKGTIDAVFNIQRLFDPIQFGVETVAYQKTLKFWIYYYAREHKIYPNVVELKTDTRVTKDMRIEALVPYVENHKVFFPGHSRETVPDWCEPLVKEMEDYPVGKYKDCLDSLSYHLQIMNRPTVRTPKATPGYTIQEVRERMRRERLALSRKGIPIIGHRKAVGDLPVTIGVNREA